MSTGEEIAAKITELGAIVAAAKKEKKPIEEWKPSLDEMLALKVSMNIYPSSCTSTDVTSFINRNYPSFNAGNSFFLGISPYANILPSFRTKSHHTTDKVQGGHWKRLRSSQEGEERKGTTGRPIRKEQSKE